MPEPRREGAREHARALKNIRTLLEKAMSDLDQLNAPADIAAHIDSALQRIMEIQGR